MSSSGDLKVNLVVLLSLVVWIFAISRFRKVPFPKQFQEGRVDWQGNQR
jgi:hypothetical protein